ncbi:DUF402 domain-containing protein [Corticicoccus populi]|uniref:DUF402 domain-containing protein n=1 Tax=Corticicoccus populi TaxID=1812821 RepID=A0ABW5X1E9_9STAP
MKSIDVLVYKYNGQKHYQWETTLLEHHNDYVLVKGDVGRELIHHTKGKTFICGTKSLEFFSTKEGFTVNIDIHDSGEMEYYCNISLPAECNMEQNIISFVDLDLDLIRDKTGRWKLVDKEEFIENAERMNYSKDTVEFAENSLKELRRKITEEYFPFDDFFEKYADRML